MSPDVVSHQVAHHTTGKRPVWIGLNPLLQPETEQTHAQAHVDYLAWVEKRQRLKAEGSPGSRQEPEKTPPAPAAPDVSPTVPAPTFFQPPTGPKPSTPIPQTTEAQHLETSTR